MTLGREVRDAFAACPEGYMLTFAAFLLAAAPAPLSAVPSIHRPRGGLGFGCARGGCVGSITMLQ